MSAEILAALQSRQLPRVYEYGSSVANPRHCKLRITFHKPFEGVRVLVRRARRDAEDNEHSRLSLGAGAGAGHAAAHAASLDS
jgi:hypothetical protein